MQNFYFKSIITWCLRYKETKMKLIKNFLWAVLIALIPFCGIALADDCFDTVIDEDGKILDIDPNDKYSDFEDREKLISLYWNTLDCSGQKKVYSADEYLNLIFQDLYGETYKKEKKSSGIVSLIEILVGVLWFIATWRIFTKAGKPWIYSIIPIYNCYEMSDIAWMSWSFKKAFMCLIAWLWMIFVSLFIFPIALFPQIGLILIYLFWIYMCVVNYNIARNFWWSVFASVLYVIFNPIAILILAFWNDKYYITEQKDQMMKMELESLVAQWIKDKENIEQNALDVNEEIKYNNPQQQENIQIKYIDPKDFKNQ